MRTRLIAALALALVALLPVAGGAQSGNADERESARTFERDLTVPASAPGAGRPVARSAGKRPKKLPTVDVNASDFTYVASRDRIFASVLAASARYPNSIVEVQPKKARVRRAIPVGANPRLLTVMPDDRTAFVAVDGPAIERVDLETGQIVSSFVPQIDTTYDYPLRVVALAADPKDYDTVAVSFMYEGISGATPGMAVYKAGVRGGDVLPNFTPTTFIFGEEPGVLWAYDSFNGHLGSMYKLVVGPSGVTSPEPPFYAMSRSGSYVTLYNGLFYTTSGRVFDYENLEFKAWYPAADTVVTDGLAIDAARNRIVFAYRSGYLLYLIVYDITTSRLASYYVGPHYGITFFPDRLAFCGRAGLAILDAHETGRIVIFPEKLLEPLEDYVAPTPVPENGTVRRIPLPNNYFVYSETTRKIYATVPGGVGGIGNSVVTLDPATGRVESSVLVGSEPASIATAGNWLYVGLWGSMELHRLRLPDLASDYAIQLKQTFSYDSPPFPRSAYQITPLPGAPGSVAVLKALEPWFAEVPGVAGIHIFDDGVERPAWAPQFASNDPIVDTFAINDRGDTIYGLNTEHTGFEFSSYTLDAHGVTYRTYGYEVGSAFFDKLRIAGDRCFTEGGNVIDGPTHTRIGRFPIPRPEIPYTLNSLPDAAHNRVYYVVGQERDAIVHVFDMTTLERIASYKIPGAYGPADEPIFYDDDKIAFTTGDAIYLVPLSALVPYTPESES